MLKTTLLALLATAAAALAAPADAAEEGTTTMQTPIAPKKTGHVPANGVNYYYAIYGEGEPLLLLHGGLGSDRHVRAESRRRWPRAAQVIGVDLHGHGRTQLGDRPIDLKRHRRRPRDRARDARLRAGRRARLFVRRRRRASGSPCSTRRWCGGWSIVSAGFAQDGFYPEMLPMQAAVGAGMAEMMKETPMYQSYAAVAPDVPRIPEAARRDGRADAPAVTTGPRT